MVQWEVIARIVDRGAGSYNRGLATFQVTDRRAFAGMATSKGTGRSLLAALAR